MGWSACHENDAHRPRAPRLRRWLALACLGGAPFLNAGCVTTGPLDYIRNGFKVGPNYCRPPAPVAEQWIEGRDPNVQSRHLQYADWSVCEHLFAGLCRKRMRRRRLRGLMRARLPIGPDLHHQR